MMDLVPEWSFSGRLRSTHFAAPSKYDPFFFLEWFKYFLPKLSRFELPSCAQLSIPHLR
jgi:hypothetical protein